MSPEDVVEKYVNEEFELIAITDHETTAGIKPAREAAESKNIKFISGIELATDMNGMELHLLGYYIDEDNLELQKAVEKLAVIREKRNRALLEVLQDSGFDITEADLIQREGQTYIGKPNFARALVKKGYIEKVSEAFLPGQFLESDRAKSVKKEMLKTEEAIELIKKAGGIPVLAHPCKIKGIGERESSEFKKNFDELLKQLKKAGLKGLECIYPACSDEERLYFISMAGKYHLHITEGSDFHGK